MEIVQPAAMEGPQTRLRRNSLFPIGEPWTLDLKHHMGLRMGPAFVRVPSWHGHHSLRFSLAQGSQPQATSEYPEQKLLELDRKCEGPVSQALLHIFQT